MAKKKDKKKEYTQEETAGSKLLTVLIVLVIVLIWLGIFGVLIKLDVGNFGSEVLSPVLKDVPVVNRILPDTGEEIEKTEGYTDINEANVRIAELEKELASLKSTNSANGDEVKELTAEVERLKKFEQQQRAFEQRVKEFDENVVYNDKAPDIAEYKSYYEEIDPDNAAEIYQDVVRDLQYTEKIKKQATMYAKMDPEQAASVLETMSGDLELVVAILDSMPETKSALILENVSPETAAQITTKMTER